MMDENKIKELIKTGRDFMKGYNDNDPYLSVFESDQDLKKPQPPLVKAKVSNDPLIVLTKDFSGLELNNDLIDVFTKRKSSRVYTGEELTIDELAFMLWASQGVKSIRGKNYATLRTVPCGGARHEYETYLLVMNVKDLKPGVYHYLPMDHALEFVKEVNDIENIANDSLSDQTWVKKANVIFYWSMDAYRAEWRYGIYAHRPALIDVGHIGQNLYLAATALNLGVCGIAAFSHEICNALFDLDGDNEYVCYTATVGTVKESDHAKEQAFYSFLDEE